MPDNEEEITEEDLEIENAEVYFQQADDGKVELDPKQLASRQLAHERKVANFLAGGKF